MTLHELGHAFALVHDFRTGRDSDYVMSFGNATRLSKCAAEWLSVNRFFNTKSTFHNEPGEIRLLSLQTYNQDVINLRFKVTDPDGLHQAQLLVPDILKDPRWAGWGPYRLFDCKRLNGKTGFVESAVRTAELVDRITLQIIDVDGNITWATFPIQLDDVVAARNVLDVNSDGIVNISDLAPLASRFGQKGKDPADVNEDRIIDIIDVLLVAASISSLPRQVVETFTAADVQKWLTDAKQLEVENEILKEGIVRLEHLLAVLTAVVVDIPDPNLRAAVETALSKTEGDSITSSEMETLTRLEAQNANISDLTGLEHAINLKALSLGGRDVDGRYVNSNSVSDLSPLAGLIHLESLDLWQNSVSDLSPIADLTYLTGLSLDGNNIADISALVDLTNLTRLWLDGNNITDISAVAGLTNLSHLGLGGNSISDLSPVAGLTALTLLRLGWTNISDISPLVANTGLGNGDTVYAQGNPLSYQSIYTHIPTLQSRGVEVGFEDRTPTTLLKISGDNQKGVTEQTLANPFVVEVQDQRGRTFLGVPVTDTAGGGTLNVTSTTTDVNGRAESTLTLGPNQGTNTVSVSAAGISQTVTFNAVAGAPVDIPNANLRAKIEAALGKAPGTTITTAEMTNLRFLIASESNISDLTGLKYATNLEILELGGESVDSEYVNSNTISNLSPLMGLTNLHSLNLWGNNISDTSPLAGLINLTSLYLGNNSISDSSVVANLTNLTELGLDDNNISDISSVAGLTQLAWLNLGSNTITDISAVAGLTNLTWLNLGSNNVLDVSVLAALTQLKTLYLRHNNISDISPLVENTGLGSGDEVDVRGNPLSYASIKSHIPALQNRGVTVEFNTRKVEKPLKISGDNQQGTVGAVLTDPFVVEVRDKNGAVFAGVPVTFAVTAGGGTLSVTSTTTDENGRAQTTLTLGTNRGTNSVAVSAAGTEGQVSFNAISNPLTIEYLWSIPGGTSLIHVPLKVSAVDGVAKTIRSIGDLYDVLGGASTVNFLITYDPPTQEWLSYFGASDRGSPGDKILTDDTGVVAGMKLPVSVLLTGEALGIDGNSTITLNPGLNVVGLPLNDSSLLRVSDLFALDGIGDNVSVIILTEAGEFKAVGRAGDPGDIEITGGQGFILTAQRAAKVAISGDGWHNVSEAAAAPLLSLKSVEIGDTTPVLGLRGSIVGEEMNPNSAGYRVIVKNLSTGKAVAAVTKDVAPSRTNTGVGYQVAIVDIETGRAAKIGDSFEISVRSPSPFIGVHPLRYTVTPEDVKRSLIQFPALVAYEIPKETELLANYPNPFNPETWIPYRLAEDAFVTLTIYDMKGQRVRTLEVGHRIASAYESRSKAIYWDGRNSVGEQVASGVYFYTLKARDFSATRRMLILK